MFSTLVTVLDFPLSIFVFLLILNTSYLPNVFYAKVAIYIHNYKS